MLWGVGDINVLPLVFQIPWVCRCLDPQTPTEKKAFRGSIHTDPQTVFGGFWKAGIYLRIFHTPGTYPRPQPTVYEGIPFIWGFGDAWGMLQGYVGVLLEFRMLFVCFLFDFFCGFDPMG